MCFQICVWFHGWGTKVPLDVFKQYSQYIGGNRRTLLSIDISSSSLSVDYSKSIRIYRARKDDVKSYRNYFSIPIKDWSQKWSLPCRYNLLSSIRIDNRVEKKRKDEANIHVGHGVRVYIQVQIWTRSLTRSLNTLAQVEVLFQVW